MRIVQALEDSNILLKGVSKTIKNKSKFLGKHAAGKGIVRAGSGNKKGKGIVRAGSGNKKGKEIVRAGYGNKIDF